MNERFFYRAVIAVLLVINVATLGYIWLGNSHLLGRLRGQRPPGDVVAFLTNELGLTPAQHDSLAVMQQSFREKFSKAEEDYRALHPPFFNQVHGSQIDSVALNRSLDSLTNGSRAIEWLTFSYFRKVRAMCTPQQQTKFDGIVEDVMRMLKPPPPAGPPPGADRPQGNPPPPQDGPRP